MKKIIFISIIIILLIFFILYKNETFTNMAGFFTKSKDCESMTLKDCLNSATCAWCMSDNFAPKCVYGQADDLLKEGKCKKVYANDVWTRAELADDNDYKDTLNLPIID